MSFLSWCFDAFCSLSACFLFQPPNFFYIPQIGNHQQHSTLDCLLEWVLQSFSLFQLAVLLMEPCFLTIRCAQSLVEVCKNNLVAVNQFIYLGFWWWILFELVMYLEYTHKYIIGYYYIQSFCSMWILYQKPIRRVYRIFMVWFICSTA